MKNKWLIVIILMSLCFTCGINFINGQETDKSYDLNFEYNEMIVVIKKEFSVEKKEFSIDYFNEINCIFIDEITKHTYEHIVNGTNNQLLNKEEFRRMFYLQIDTNSMDELVDAINIIKGKVEVEDAFPNYVFEICNENTEITNENTEIWWLSEENGISIEGAWNYTTGSKEVKVGIIDTGIDRNEDLVSNIYSLLPELNKDFTLQEDGSIENPFEDKVGHGTHVAGIIGALDNGENILGEEIVGVCKEVSLISLKITKTGQSDNYSVYNDYYTLSSAIEYAIENDIMILNFSGLLHGDEDKGTGFIPENNLAYEYPDMVRNFVGYSLAKYEGLFVCAAGNTGKNISTNDVPAYYSMLSDRIISVGAHDKDRDICSFSNYDRDAVSIFAPGNNIISTFPKSTNELLILNEEIIVQNNKNNGYAILSGTSMATPFVTGTAALLLSIKPDITAEQIKRTILDNADYSTFLNERCVCDGVLNAFKAVSATVFNTTKLSEGILINGYEDYYTGENCTKLVFPKEFAPFREISDYNNTVNRNNLKSQQKIVGINSNAFKNNTIIETVELPNTIKYIYDSAFEGCTNLKEINIPEGVTTIGSSAFAGCTSLESITLPSSLQYIEANTFEGCINLKEINMQNGITVIGESAFDSCESLERITFSENLLSIDDYAFYGCSLLEEIIFNDKITNIGSYVFSNCESLINVNMPNSIISIGEFSFSNCNNLEEIMISNNINCLEKSIFRNCSNLESVNIPNCVNIIKDQAFENCSKLVNVSLPSNLTIIKSCAFKNCINIDEIIIPNQVQLIEYNAFGGCSNLNKVIITKLENPIVILEPIVFNGCSSLSNIIVPYDKILQYKNSLNWTVYKSIITSNVEIEHEVLNCNGLNRIYNINEGRNLIRKLIVDCDYIYKFNICGYEELDIKLYNESFELINYEFTNDDYYNYVLDVPLVNGIYYIDIFYLDNTMEDEVEINISTNIQEDGYETYLNEEYDFSNHLHYSDNNYKSFIKYNHLNNNGLYKIGLNNVNNLDSGSITIFTDNERTNVLESYNINNFENNAISKINDNCLYVYLHYNTTYYITITLSEYQSGSLLIEDIPNTFELSIFNQTNIMSGEAVNVLNLSDDLLNYSYFKKLVIKETGLFNTVISYNGNQTTNIKVLLIKKDVNNEYINLNTFTLNNLSSTINYPYRILENGTYYIGYYNLDKSKCDNINVSFSRFVDNDSDSVYNGLLVDPNAPGMHGTQIGIVEKNTTNKSYGETYITKGFTRLIFIDGSFGYQTSRTSYAWYSSDENVLSVTSYGTVLGKSEGTAKVIGVNKDNPSIIFVKEFTIIDNIDEEIHIIEINQTYDINSNDELILNLNASNCPYPYIQYYEFEIVECAGDTYLNAFGRIIANTPGVIVVEGVYTLNRNYRLSITIYVDN